MLIHWCICNLCKRKSNIWRYSSWNLGNMHAFKCGAAIYWILSMCSSLASSTCKKLLKMTCDMIKSSYDPHTLIPVVLSPARIDTLWLHLSHQIGSPRNYTRSRICIELDGFTCHTKLGAQKLHPIIICIELYRFLF